MGALARFGVAVPPVQGTAPLVQALLGAQYTLFVVLPDAQGVSRYPGALTGQGGS